MSRPKGSKNKAKAPETKTMTKEETAEWYLKDAKRMKERYSPENTELAERAQFVAPGFTEEMAKRGVWLKQIEDFCAKKGFTPSELIERFEELERDKLFATSQLGEMIANSSHVTSHFDLTPLQIKEKYGEEIYERALRFIRGQNMPDCAPQSGTFIPDSPYGSDTTSHKDGAEDGGIIGRMNALASESMNRYLDKGKEPTKSAPLSKYMQERQALKNNQK